VELKGREATDDYIAEESLNKLRLSISLSKTLLSVENA